MTKKQFKELRAVTLNDSTIKGKGRVLMRVVIWMAIRQKECEGVFKFSFHCDDLEEKVLKLCFHYMKISAQITHISIFSWIPVINIVQHYWANS